MIDDELDIDPAEPLSRRQIVAIAGVLTLLAAVATMAVVVIAGMSGTDAPRTAAGASRGMVEPLDMSTVPDDIAAHYHHAQAHLAEYQQIPCWCGCEQFLAHRTLTDCFVRADGRGWEAHAAGCGVCTAEALMTESTLDRGGTAAEAKAA